MARRSPLSPQQRTKAVLALLQREEPASKIARRYGVSEKTLNSWRDAFVTGGEVQLARKTGKASEDERKLEKLERKLAKRDQVIGELTVANRILKKISDDCGLPPPSEDL